MSVKQRAAGLPPLGVHIRAWLTHAGEAVMGDRHLTILEAIRELGSLNAAARRLHMSYRDVWGKIRQAEAALGVALIRAQVGGARGGGSRLTPAADTLVARLRALQREQQQAATHAARVYFGRAPSARPRRGADRLVLATTTSVVDTGLLSALLPPFEERFGVRVDVFPVGSGAALRWARAGSADVVFVHAPEAEERAVATGVAVNRRQVMANEFVIVGPTGDPAGVRQTRSVRAALRRIAAAHAAFLSRGDGSGTHQRERALFAAAQIVPAAWYRREHAGMAALLRRANAATGYALADRGTLAALADDLALDVLYTGGPELLNVYSVLATNPQRCAQANYLAAMALIGWLTSPAAQELIATYRVGGRPVARPASITRRGRQPTR